MKNIFNFCLCVIMACSTQTVTAQKKIDGIYYKFLDNSSELMVTCPQDRSGYKKSNGYSGDITIPETVMYKGKVYTVTRIDAQTFSGCTSLTSISIPSSVIEIGKGTFSGCTGLKSISIPNGVICIEAQTFENCTGLTSFIIPNSVTEIGSGAFKKCSSLTSVTILGNVTTIGNEAFQSCTNLNSIDIPNSVSSIGDFAFNATKLTSIAIPDKVEHINEGTFYGCTHLSSVEIGKNVQDIKPWAFGYCVRLTSITFTNNNLREIYPSAFFGCKSLSIKIPGSVVKIGKDAFKGVASVKPENENQWQMINE